MINGGYKIDMHIGLMYKSTIRNLKGSRKFTSREMMKIIQLRFQITFPSQNKNKNQ